MYLGYDERNHEQNRQTIENKCGVGGWSPAYDGFTELSDSHRENLRYVYFFF